MVDLERLLEDLRHEVQIQKAELPHLTQFPGFPEDRSVIQLAEFWMFIQGRPADGLAEAVRQNLDDETFGWLSNHDNTIHWLRGHVDWEHTLIVAWYNQME